VTAYSAWRLVVRYPQSTKTWTLNAIYKPRCSSYRSQSQIFVENRYYSLLHLHSTPPLGVSPTEYCHDVWYGITTMVWLPDGGKDFEGMFIRFDRIHERDGRTDGQTDGRTDTRMTAKAALA